VRANDAHTWTVAKDSQDTKEGKALMRFNIQWDERAKSVTHVLFFSRWF
jgi:hypothetical protein